MFRLSTLAFCAGLLFANARTSVFADESAQTSLSVTNHQDESTVRYSAILLRGTLPAQVSSLKLERVPAAVSSQPKPLVYKGKFKALVQLSEGKNEIRLSADGVAQTSIVIHYQPQTNPHYVRLVWMTDNAGETKFAAPSDDVPQDYEARLRTAALLMQTFTAERMHELGYGRRTFRLERDNNGEVVVHTWKGPKSRQEYYAMGDSGRWWNDVRQWINQDHPDPMAKNVVLAAYTRKDDSGKMKGHTALGGANLGLFGSASVFSWPRSIPQAVDCFLDDSRYDTTKVHDDSVGRSTIWGLASTTIGATLHETGHAFGLPHCNDGFGIMSRGFDHFNRFFTFQNPPSGRNRKAVRYEPEQEAYFAPESASYLRWSRWFALDKPAKTTTRPRISVDKKAGTVFIQCDSGIAWVGFHANGNIATFREFKQGTLPKEVTYTMKEIANELKGKKLDRIRAVSSDGGEQGNRI